MKIRRIAGCLLFAAVGLVTLREISGECLETYENIREYEGRGAGIPAENYELPDGFTVPAGAVYECPDGQITVTMNETAGDPALSKELFSMYPGTTDEEKMTLNREHLQEIMDRVSEAGGGTVTVAAGIYYFNRAEEAFAYFNSPDQVFHCLYPRENVTLSGTRGADGALETWLNPYGDYRGACNMFFYYSDDPSGICLENADFRDFGIDGNGNHNLCNYNANGKGFMMAPIRDCDWYNVAVMNTDGTGFGVDETIGCTISHCTAIGCGKQAATDSIGGSGFGIGYGLSPEESMRISNCLAIGNRRFGIFYECQKRFRPSLYSYYSVNGPLLAENCIAAGNDHNYGGEYCYGSEYVDCVSLTEIPAGFENPLGTTTVKDYYFGVHSANNYITTGGERTLADGVLYSDVIQGSWYFDAVSYAKERGFMSGYDLQRFGPADTLLRAQAVAVFCRAAGESAEETGECFPDVPESSWYAGYVFWAYQNDIVSGYGNGCFGPADPLNREQLAVILYRYAGHFSISLPEDEDVPFFTDRNAVTSYAKEAVLWCVRTGIIRGKTREDGSRHLDPQGAVSRAECAAMIGNFLKRSGR